ncbi:hypothetical protein EDD21DRAFT_362311 [Dissophora ornata]|nr:hypothetical protein EDD21DRAFT_362311 [Dissophora ornata]
MSALDTRRFSAMSDIQSTAFDRESNAGECGMDKKAKATKTAKEKKSKKEAPSATAGPAKAISDSRKTKGAATKRGRTSSSPKESSEVKRQKFLERNRMAASKCREKKRLQTLKTISDADEITARNQALHETLDQLQEEVWRLKNQILCHRNCGCDVIQKFVQSSFDYNAPPAPSFAVPASVVQMQLY